MGPESWQEKGLENQNLSVLLIFETKHMICEELCKYFIPNFKDSAVGTVHCDGPWARGTPCLSPIDIS